MSIHCYCSELLTVCDPKGFSNWNKALMETKQIKRIMLANLNPGECIAYISFKRGQPVRLEAEVIRVESEYNAGRLWTTHGPLPWQSLTAKYEVRL